MSTELKPSACRCQFASKNQLELIVSGRGEAVLLPAAVFPEGDGAADFANAACVHVREEQQAVVGGLVDGFDGLKTMPAQDMLDARRQPEPFNRGAHAAAQDPDQLFD